MKTSRKTVRPKYDEVDRAFIRVQRAIHDLVELLIGDDLAVAGKAAGALGQVRFLPAGPLAVGLVQATLPVRRVVMLNLIRGIAPPFDLELISILTLVLANDPSDEVKAAAEQVLGEIRDRSLQVYKKQAPREPAQPQGQPEVGQAPAGC
jgi:hypothetical protein